MLIVVGLAGAGKSTVLKKFIEERKDISIVNYGDLALNVALKNKYAEDRDRINSLSSKVHKRIQEDVVKQLKDTPKTIIDTHAILKHDPGYIAGITPGLLKKVNIEGFVFIDASSEEVLLRRQKDKTRTRAMLTKEEIDNDRLLCKALICSYVSQLGVPFYFIHNGEGKLEDSVNEMKKIAKDLEW